MNIVLTGSLGHISKPLATNLLSGGHQVTVISSDPKKQSIIEDMGGSAAIGSIEDVDFLIRTFREAKADALYAMIPLNPTEPDLAGYFKRVSQNYVQAIQAVGIKRVVVLSGWAADLIPGENAEVIFEAIADDTSLTFLRPAVFYNNFYQFTDLIKAKGLMGKLLTLRYAGLGALLAAKTGVIIGNYGGEDRVVFVSPLDIADEVAVQLVMRAGHEKICYVGSEEMTCNEAARIIGSAVGKPWLKWVLLTDKEMKRGLNMAKMPEKLADTLTSMQAAIHSGKALENFHSHPYKMGKVKLEDFALEFAKVYQQKP